MIHRVARLRLIQASLLAASFGIAPAAALAEDPPFSDLPPFLLERLAHGGTVDEYLQRLTQEAALGDLDGNGLDQQDIDLAEQVQAAQYRAGLVQHLVASDLDANGEVTIEEATRAATFQMGRQGDAEEAAAIEARKKQIAQAVEQVMKLDSNGDGAVTLAEAMQAGPPENRRERKLGRYEELLALDPNQDGRLTFEELDRVALQAFRAVDYNHDGVLTNAEAKLLAPALDLQRRSKQAR